MPGSLTKGASDARVAGIPHHPLLPEAAKGHFGNAAEFRLDPPQDCAKPDVNIANKDGGAVVSFKTKKNDSGEPPGPAPSVPPPPGAGVPWGGSRTLPPPLPRAGEEYSCELALAGTVKEDDVKVSRTDRHIILVLNKEEEARWGKLVAGKAPTWVKVDWDKWVDSDDEEDMMAGGMGGMPGGFDMSQFDSLANFQGMGGDGDDAGAFGEGDSDDDEDDAPLPDLAQ